MRYSDSDYRKCKEADVRIFVPDLHGRGSKIYAKCPFCHDEKSLKYDAKHNGMHCFKCDSHISGPLGAVMAFQGVKEGEALSIVAKELGIFSMEERRGNSIAENKRKIKKSFCERQLEESGLSIDDVTAKVYEDGVVTYKSTFRRGGKENGNYNDTDDEMLIYYYDLNGSLMTYAKRGGGNKLRPYIRVRWSNPAAHKDASGREAKYEQPAGAPTRLYIPQRIRAAYQNEEQIDTLVVQEGEKKAEKACKHGILSVGIQGIYNIGNEETGLIQDLQYIVQKCRVKNVILLFDSDWDHLGKNIEAGSRIDYRPNSFFGAARKFKSYVQTLHGVGCSVDIFIAHINENQKGDKGIDDLLTNSLKGAEHLLSEDLKAALLTHDGKGQHVTLYKITTKTDNQIKDIWKLNDPSAFFEKYHDQLVSLPTFRFGYFSYKVEDGKISQATKTSDKDFWTVSRPETGNKKIIEFDAYEAIEFVSANGFYRIHTSDLPVDQYKFVRIDNGIVYLSGPTEIRDLVFAYILSASKDKDVRSYFASRLGSLLGADKLERVQKIEDTFDRFEPLIQRIYYLNGQVEITSEGVVHSDRIIGQVWSDKLIQRKFKRVPIISSISKLDNGSYHIAVTEEGRKCEFLQFLQNTSNFWSKPGYEPTAKDDEEFSKHMVNKITTIGYLLADYKYQTEQKAVIAMDGQLGDVGQSNGRTGKSLVGKAIGHMVEQAYIDGRATKNDDDYLYSTVTLRTRNIFLDDVKTNFDFGRFFGSITGDLAVNPKQMARFVIKNSRSPKFYITTNHAINENSRSALDRIAYMAFSNWYNDFHSPIDDFKHSLFQDWEDDQWNLFDNLMVECIMFYFRSYVEGWHKTGRGAVPPPMSDINLRTYKQLMGEAFFQWAEIFYETSAEHLNTRIERKVIYDAFHAAFPDAKMAVSASNFKTKLEYYCKFKGYHLNISERSKEEVSFADFRKEYPTESFIGKADKSGGKEYLSVYSTEFADKQPF